MAKDAQINIKINSKDGVNGINDLDNSVGDVNKELKNLKQQLGETKTAMQGLDAGSAEFQALAAEAAKYKQQLDLIEGSVNELSNSQLGLQQGTEIIGGLTAAYGVGLGALTLFGVEQENLVKVIAKLQAVQNISNGVMQVANLLDQKSATGKLLASTRTALFSGTLTAQSVATGAATLATRALSVAMNALPLVAVIGAVTGLIAVFSDYGDAVEETATSTTKADKDFADQINTGTSSIESNLTKRIKKEDELFQSILLRRQAEGASEEELTQLVLDNNKKRVETVDEAIAREIETINQLQKEYTDKEEWASPKALAAIQSDIDERNKQLEGLLNTKIEINKKQAESDAEAAAAAKKAAEDALKRAQDNAKLLMQIENEKINASIGLLDKEINEKIKAEGFASETTIALMQERKAKEEEIIQNKYKFEIDFAKGNSKQIELLNAQKNNELFKLEQQYTTNFANEIDKRLKFVEDRIAAEIAAQQGLNEALTEKRMQQELLDVDSETKRLVGLEKSVAKQREIIAQGEEQKAAITKKYDAEFLQQKIADLEVFKLRTLSNVKLTETKRKEIIAKTEAEILKLKGEYIQQTTDLTATQLEQLDESIKEFLEKNQEVIAATFATAAQISEIFQAASDEQNKREIAAINAKYSLEAEQHKAMLANKTINQEEYDNLTQAAEFRKAEDEKRLRIKAFRQQKNYQTVTAVMNVAQGVLQALGSMPPPFSFIMAAATAALGAIQIAQIRSQKFTAARGGVVPGQPSQNDSVNAMLAPGEMVVNAQSAQMFPELISRINMAGGGIPLAPESANTSRVRETVFDGGSQQEMRAYVVESDISRTQKRVSRYENNAEF
jgi:hypothetical protein